MIGGTNETWLVNQMSVEGAPAALEAEEAELVRRTLTVGQHNRLISCSGIDSNLYVASLPATSIGPLASFRCERVSNLKRTGFHQLQYGRVQFAECFQQDEAVCALFHG